MQWQPRTPHVGPSDPGEMALPQILSDKLTVFQSEGEVEITPTTFLNSCPAYPLDFLILLRPCRAIKSTLSLDLKLRISFGNVVEKLRPDYMVSRCWIED